LDLTGVFEYAIECMSGVTAHINLSPFEVPWKALSQRGCFSK
jgi:hypothetical protein